MDKAVKLSKRTSKLFVGADTIKKKNFKEPEYLVDKLVPRGTLCALVGESDTGKSSLLRQLALSLAYGDNDFLGFKIKGSCNNVLYVSTEDGEAATSYWLNRYFGEDVPQDDLLAKVFFTFRTDENHNFCFWPPSGPHLARTSTSDASQNPKQHC